VTTVVTGARSIAVTFEPEWDAQAAHAARIGFFAMDPRVRTLLRVLLSYPEVRYIVHDRISLDVGAGAPLLETIAHFLERQRWLVKRVDID
jgi:hypothetical protein